MAGMTSVSSEFASALILCGPRGGGPSLVSRFDLVLEEEPTKKPANHDGLWKEFDELLRSCPRLHRHGALSQSYKRSGASSADRRLASRR